MPPKLPPARQPAAPTRPTVSQVARNTQPPADDSAGEYADYLKSGTAADAAVKASAKGGGGAREFFITAKEIAKSANGQVEVKVHFAANYADPDMTVVVPRVTIKENGNFTSYTSPDNGDCALRAAGMRVSNRPAYILVDHREYTKKDGSQGKDNIKLWIPQPSTYGVIQAAMRNLAEALEAEVEDLDIRQYQATITKIGTGRSSTWSVSFMPRPKPLGADVQKAVDEFFKDGYRQTMGRLLAPDPRFLISKGGHYTKPADTDAAGEDEPPY